MVIRTSLLSVCVVSIFGATAFSNADAQTVAPAGSATGKPVIDGEPLDHWLSQLKSDQPDDEARQTATTALGNVQSENPQILEALSNAAKSDDRSLRLAAIRSLRNQGTAAVPVLRKHLQSDNEMIQAATLESLRHLGPLAIDALPDLWLLIEDDSETVYIRQNAVRCLAAMGQSAATAVDRLHAMLRDDRANTTSDYWKHSILRHQVILALSRLGPRGEVAIPTLVDMLKHPVQGEKRYVTELGSPAAIGLMAPILRRDEKGSHTNSSDEEIVCLIRALTHFGNAADEAIPLLRLISRDPEMLPAIRELATQSLTQFTKVENE